MERRSGGGVGLDWTDAGQSWTRALGERERAGKMDGRKLDGS